MITLRTERSNNRTFGVAVHEDEAGFPNDGCVRQAAFEKQQRGKQARRELRWPRTTTTGSLFLAVEVAKRRPVVGCREAGQEPESINHPTKTLELHKKKEHRSDGGSDRE